MLRRTLRWRHNIRDRSSNSHALPFDDLSRIYRDAVRPPESILPERRPAGAPLSQAGTTPPPGYVGGTAAGSGKRPVRLSFSGTPLPRHSGQQLEVLQLYRDLMRAAGQKRDPATVSSLKDQIRAEFKTNRDIGRKYVTKIEWLMHRGRTKLDDIKNLKSTTRFSVMQ